MSSRSSDSKVSVLQSGERIIYGLIVILCRQETAASVTFLARILGKSTSPLRVLDLCTGTGCIPLLFHNVFYSDQPTDSTSQASLDLLGVDISSTALSLARENLVHQIASQAQTQASSQERTRSLHRIGYIQADVLDIEESLLPALARVSHRDDEDFTPSFDVLISNPPYISPSAHLPRSVRLYEPELALIPDTLSSSSKVRGDEFFPALLQAAERVNARVLLLEVGDMEQAKRVVGMLAAEALWEKVEIWRDHPSQVLNEEIIKIAGQNVPVRGGGNGRSVFAVRGDAIGWTLL